MGPRGWKIVQLIIVELGESADVLSFPSVQFFNALLAFEVCSQTEQILTQEPQDSELVGGLEHFLFSIIYGMSSFPLTNSYISR